MGDDPGGLFVREPGELSRLLVASVMDYTIYLVDLTGHVRTWNDGARRIKGYAAEEVTGRHGGQLWAESAGEGQGSTFHLWLPADADDRRARRVREEDPA